MKLLRFYRQYRAYGEDGEELTVGYGKVFEDEYARCVAEKLDGDIEAAIRQLAECRRREREA